MIEVHQGYKKLITSTKFGVLKALVPYNRMHTEKSAFQRMDPDLADMFELRKQVQRLLTGRKKKNVLAFAEYIRRGITGEDGYSLPPIAMYCHDEVAVLDLENDPFDFDKHGFGPHGPAQLLITPSVTRVIAFDGETQFTALWTLYEQSRNEVGFRERLLAMPLTVEFHFDTTLDWARQAFHDRNVYGVNVTSSLAIGMDNRDPYTAVMRYVSERVPALKGRISTAKRQLSRNDREVVTASAMRQFIATFHDGIGALQRRGVVRLDKDVREELENNALDWTRRVTDLLQHRLERRNQYLCSAPSVLAALGAVGHDAYYGDESPERLVARLENVDWARDEHWAGIAGKVSTSGRFSVGGPKEVSGHIYSALSDETSDGYLQVRQRHQA
jgi:DNA sulfur modification protein DndB